MTETTKTHSRKKKDNLNRPTVSENNQPVNKICSQRKAQTQIASPPNSSKSLRRINTNSSQKNVRKGNTSKSFYNISLP